MVCHCLTSSSLGRNLKFVQGAGGGSPPLHKGHRGVFIVHQPMSADVTHSSKSVRGLAHTLMNHLACETMGRHFIAGSGYKPRGDSLEESSVHTLRSSCQSSVSSIHSYSSPPSQRAFPRQWTTSLDTCPLFIPEVTIHFQSRPVTL